MKIYLASRYSRYPEMQMYAAELAQMGHSITSRWIQGDHELRADGHSNDAHWQIQWAEEDYQDLLQACLCLSFTEAPGDTPGRNRGGRHVELGIALASNKLCLVVGPREHVFHWLPQVIVLPAWPEAAQWLRTHRAIVARPAHALYSTDDNPFFTL